MSALLSFAPPNRAEVPAPPAPDQPLPPPGEPDAPLPDPKGPETPDD